MVGTQQVWARVAWAVLALGRELGAADQLLAGMPFDEAGLRARKRITWDEYCTMIERLCIAAAGAVVSPKLLYRFVLEVLDPIAFPMAEFRYEDLGGDRIRLSMGLLPGVR